MDFSYVYILRSEADLARFYTGLTDDLKDRLHHSRMLCAMILVNVERAYEREMDALTY